jgi:phage tail sheath protein FI
MYNKLDPSAVDSTDIIGGVDVTSGAYTGMELINQVFPKFRLVVGQICAPHWSTKPDVAAVMEAKAQAINGVFRAICLCDIPTDTVMKYSDAPGWKNTNNYEFTRQAVCWPKVKLGNKIFHMSTQMAGLTCLLDSQNQDIPYESSSNKNLQMDGMCLADGTPVSYGMDEANYLNGQGITTALNWIGGWRLWGNRTAAYPANTDPKDSFLSIRRMFDWNGNVFLQTYWQKVDKPVNRVLIETLVDSENIRLNGLTSRGYILGGRMAFLPAENPTTDLMNGIIRFHSYITPPTPAEEIDDVLEYDTNYLSTLFGSGK